MMLKETLSLLLGGIGRSDEYEFYLERFRSYESPCFCVLIPDLETIEESRGSILASLEFLMKLDLYPGLLFAGVAATDARTLSFLELAGGLIRTVNITEHKNIAAVARSEATEARKAHRIPVFSFCGTLDQSILHLTGLTQRFHLLRLPGPVHAADGYVPYLDPKSMPSSIPEEDRALADFVGSILEKKQLHISLCSPYRLLNEIFTVKGSGTVFRPRSRILHVQNPEELDRRRLVDLLESSFGKTLKNLQFLDRVLDFYIEENYRGAVLLESSGAGTYLSKFAVSTLARGEGIAQDLCNAVTPAHPSVFWRARRGNSIERWYARIADGMHRTGKWNVYWKNIDLSRLTDVIRYCETREEDFSNAA